MTDVTIRVPDIHCDNCQLAIEGALRPLAGVARADVDVATKQVRVSFEEPATPGALRTAIEEQGYDVASMD
jgi:copper chaperone